MENESIESLARRLAASVPEGMRSLANDLGGDLEKNFQSVLKGTLSRMDLVSREEFDVQATVLARTREKLERLERDLAALESQFGANKD